MIEYQLLQAPYDEALIDEVHALATAALGGLERAELAWRLAEMPRPSVCIARTSELVGFKIGYAVARTRYHSWLGAVHPDWRRQGIALELLQRQHRWLSEHGFGAVETVTRPGNLAMLGLNLRAGFRIIGTYCRDDGAQRVTLAKALPAR